MYQRIIKWQNNIASIEFASRWRRELASLEVEAGKNLSKDIKKSYSLSNESPVPGKVLSPRDREQNKLRENIYKEKDKAIKKRQSLKIDKTPNKPISSAKASSSNRAIKLENLREKYKRNTLPPSNNTNVKTGFDFSNVSKKPFRLSRTKLGLGALGLAATGAIGYGMYRKMRNDKGKKRGKYTRN